MSLGLCAIVLVLQACLLCCITCVHLSQLSRPTPYVSRLVCSSCGSLGPPTAPGGLCALQRFVCHASLGNPGLPSEPQDFSGLLLFPRVWPPYMSCLWAEKCTFLCFLSSKSLLCPAFWDSTAPPWAPCEGASQCTGALPTSRLPSSGHRLLSRGSPSFPFLCLHPLYYLIPASLACPHGGLASSAVVWRLLCRNCSVSWWVFYVFVGRVAISPSIPSQASSTTPQKIFYYSFDFCVCDWSAHIFYFFLVPLWKVIFF